MQVPPVARLATEDLADVSEEGTDTGASVSGVQWMGGISPRKPRASSLAQITVDTVEDTEEAPPLPPFERRESSNSQLLSVRSHLASSETSNSLSESRGSTARLSTADTFGRPSKRATIDFVRRDSWRESSCSVLHPVAERQSMESILASKTPPQTSAMLPSPQDPVQLSPTLGNRVSVEPVAGYWEFNSLLAPDDRPPHFRPPPRKSSRPKTPRKQKRPRTGNAVTRPATAVSVMSEVFEDYATCVSYISSRSGESEADADCEDEPSAQVASATSTSFKRYSPRLSLFNPSSPNVPESPRLTISRLTGNKIDSPSKIILALRTALTESERKRLSLEKEIQNVKRQSRLSTTVTLLQDQNGRLVDENTELKSENNNLRNEKAELLDQLSRMKEVMDNISTLNIASS
ncbi:hypothetical protein BT69DRAFT_1338347 [Atractiella rhizophila]|nr:hypothetical protein BT69DRAFT_1338347 [Atractiella rhizophila]